jgi:hypothetical protein
MEALILILIFIGFIGLSFLHHKSQVKRSLMGGNFLLESDTASKLVNNLEQKELSEREKRLMTNSRYRVLKGFLVEELTAIKAMSTESFRESTPSGKSKRIVSHTDFNVFIKLNATFHTNTSATVKVSVYPERFLGLFIFGIEEWVELKS